MYTFCIRSFKYLIECNPIFLQQPWLLFYLCYKRDNIHTCTLITIWSFLDPPQCSVGFTTIANVIFFLIKFPPFIIQSVSWAAFRLYFGKKQFTVLMTLYSLKHNAVFSSNVTNENIFFRIHAILSFTFIMSSNQCLEIYLLPKT